MLKFCWKNNRDKNKYTYIQGNSHISDLRIAATNATLSKRLDRPLKSYILLYITLAIQVQEPYNI